MLSLPQFIVHLRIIFSYRTFKSNLVNISESSCHHSKIHPKAIRKSIRVIKRKIASHLSQEESHHSSK